MNPRRGEAQLVAEHGDGRWFIQFTHNALAALEDALDLPLMKLGALIESENLGIRELRTMVWAGLEGWRRKNANGQAPYSAEDAGDVMDAVGFEACLDVTTDALTAAFGEPDQPQGVGRPPQASESGTGESS